MLYAKLRQFHTGARFTNDFLPAFQIRWKLRCCNYVVAITVLESRWEGNEFSIEFELRCENRKNRPGVSMCWCHG